MTKTRVTIEGDLTVRMVRNLLEGVTSSWRLTGQADGSIVAAPAARKPARPWEEIEDEEPDELWGEEDGSEEGEDDGS